jgi:hypothetical protein
VNRNNLNYIGVKPDFKYYPVSKISEVEYNNININININNNWNLKEECFKYLKNDVEGLFEIIINVSEYILF